MLEPLGAIHGQPASHVRTGAFAPLESRFPLAGASVSTVWPTGYQDAELRHYLAISVVRLRVQTLEDI